MSTNEASHASFDNSMDSMVDELETTQAEKPRPVKNYHNNVVVIEQTQYWQKKSNFSPVLNLAAINQEKNIFELSKPNSHVVNKNGRYKKARVVPASE